MLKLSLVGVLVAVVVAGSPVPAAGGASDAYVPLKDPGQPPWEYRLADVRVELESHSPFSQCAVHLITIRGDGSGECKCEGSDQEPRGFTVTEDEVLGLLSRAHNVYFFDMPPSYHGTLQVVVGEDGLARVCGTADVGGKWRGLTVTIGDYTKRVEARDGYPEELRELMGFIQEFALRCIDESGGRPSN